MNILSDVLTTILPTPGEKRGAGISTYLDMLSGTTGISRVNGKGALTIPAYYAGVNQIANDIAKLPKGIYRRDEGNRQEVDHPAKYLIANEPNEVMSSFVFHFVMVLSAIHCGNGIAIIERNPVTGIEERFVFVHPEDLHGIRKIQGRLWYFTKYGTYSAADILHFLGFTTNGYIGQSLISYAAETLGIAKSAQSFTADNFNNRGLGFGVIETEKAMTKGKRKVEGAVNDKLSATGKIKTVMLDEGMKYKPITLNMQEAQLIEQGKFSVVDIARFLLISPRKLMDTSGDNYATAYQASTDHINDTIQPWRIRIEQEYDRKIFTPEQKRDHYVRFNDNVLLRGDLPAKADYYMKMAMMGIMNRNEIRALEELNSVEGLEEHLTPTNTFTPEQIQKILSDEK